MILLIYRASQVRHELLQMLSEGGAQWIRLDSTRYSDDGRQVVATANAARGEMS